MTDTQDKGKEGSPLIGRVYPVLDKGSVVLLDFMGSDQRIVEAARVSTGSKSEPERDRNLILFLMENHHGTPFEHAVFQFLIKCPIFVARQWFRHRIASYNERSARYRVFQEEYYTPSLKDLPPIFNEQDLEGYKEAMGNAHQFYEKMMEKAKPFREHRQRTREVFRGLLGTAYYTEFYWSINFRSLMNFISLRTGKGAQPEIQRYADVIAGIAKELLPMSYEAFEKLVLKQ